MKNKAWLGVLPVLFFVGLLVGSLFVFKTEEQGKMVYEKHCSGCHMEKGQGLANLIPPIRASDWIAKNPAQIACIIRHGQKGAIQVNGKTYNQPMQANTKLSEVEIYNVVNYLLSNFGNKIPKRSLEEIKTDLESCD